MRLHAAMVLYNLHDLSSSSHSYMYHSLMNDHLLLKQYPPLLLKFLYGIKVHSNECLTWSKLCMEFEMHSLQHYPYLGWETSCNTSLKVTMKHLCVDERSYNSGSRILSYTMFTVTRCCSECCVPSGLNFKAAGDSIVRDLSNYLLWGHRVTVNMTWALFHDKTQKHSTLLGRHVRGSTHGRSFSWNYCTSPLFSSSSRYSSEL